MSYMEESHRFESFAKFPLKFFDTKKAANFGFYYVGQKDVVKCVECELELMDWKPNDDLHKAHLWFSPQCQLAKENEAIEKRKKDSMPHYPAYLTYHSRLVSFDRWPKFSPVSIENLADAGFFYTGLSDRAQCYFCGCTLINWEIDDNPWEEHIKYSPDCHYAKLVKGG